MNVARPDPIADALVRATAVLGATQSPTGSWKGDYSGPLFLPPMLVATWHLIDHDPGDEVRAGVVRYLRGTQNDDGGWGLGIEGSSVVFTSVLNVVALRLLDVPADDPDVVRARTWIRHHGGPLGAASWGKFVLALLGLYAWEGLHPVPPETWLLPRALPVHPGRLWCHARMVYLPMSWLYGRRATGRITGRILDLRDELYDGGWDHVDWVAARERVAPTDAATPRTPELATMHAALHAWERIVPGALRRRALDHVLDQVRYEDDVSDSICIGPVNKLYDLIVWHVQGDRARVQRHLERLDDYLFTDESGTRMNGYNSSELWDTAFACQALAAAGDAVDAGPILERAMAFVVDQQVLEDPPDRHRYHREAAAGAWPFSTREHGWPITDCTAEGLQACLALPSHAQPPIERLDQAVQRLIEWQNPDGGWASYERTRAPEWLERLNPSDAFREIMIDHTHPECTGASVRALAAWRRAHPERSGADVDRAIRRGVTALRTLQQPDGAWRGGWGVCFTYGTWFGVTGLIAGGVPTTNPAIRRAVDYLASIQLTDGGWGERIESCQSPVTVPTEEGQAVMTSWALLALAAAGRAHDDVAQRGLRFLLDRQRPDGSWPPEHVAGVFNQTCAIHYDAYLRVFPVWALAVLRAEGALPRSP